MDMQELRLEAPPPDEPSEAPEEMIVDGWSEPDLAFRTPRWILLHGAEEDDD